MFFMYSQIIEYLQILIVIVGKLLVKMQSVGATYVVFVLGIYKIVNLLAFLDTGLNKLKAVLPNHCIVLCTMYYQQFSIKLIHIIENAGFLVTFWVLVRSIHIAFAVHYFVVFPVNNRAATGCDFKNAGTPEFQRKC